MDAPKQVIELASGRHPEQAFVGLFGVVEYAVWDSAWQPDQVARRGIRFRTLKDKVELSF